MPSSFSLVPEGHKPKQDLQGHVLKDTGATFPMFTRALGPGPRTTASTNGRIRSLQLVLGLLGYMRARPNTWALVSDSLSCGDADYGVCFFPSVLHYSLPGAEPAPAACAEANALPLGYVSSPGSGFLSASLSINGVIICLTRSEELMCVHAQPVSALVST